MYIADTHSDTLFSLGVMGRKMSDGHITAERLRQGGVTLQTFALWSGPKGPTGDYQGIAAREYAAVQTLLDEGLIQVDDPADAKVGQNQFLLSLEGCEVLDSVEAVQLWRERGVRIGAPVWNNVNHIGTPAKVNADDGITQEGVKIIRAMQNAGIAVDVSHLNEQGFWDLYRVGLRPPMASHSCCRALCDHFRNLTDDQLRMMIQYSGFVGVNFYPAFLSNDGKADSVTIAQHIDHICQLGGVDIVGFGSDFDGIETTPEDVNHPGEIGNILRALRDYGYNEEAIEKIAGRNFVEYMSRLK